MKKKFDFSGWATRNNLKCSDGRVIKQDAFKDDDNRIVPLVWNHQHNEPFNVLGHALLKNHKDGVRAECTFNEDTEQGRNAKALVDHGDITALSIYANQLRQRGADVMHGVIREVSLVLAGANPGAYIDDVAIAHSDEDFGEAIIYTGMEIDLSHSEIDEDEKPETITKDKDPAILMHAEDPKPENEPETKPEAKEEELKHADEIKKEKDMKDDEKKTPETKDDETIGDVFNTLSEKQKTVVYALIGQAIEDSKDKKSDDDDEEDKEMKHNIFETENSTAADDALMHDAMNVIIGDAKRFGSLKESFLQHAGEYGITNIDYLFPDEKNINTPPGFIRRPDGWVKKVMDGVGHTPFSRVKSMFADLTADEARAKGYIKGTRKVDEVITLLKRAVTPVTIYKKQKLDRDDIVDITDFDVVSWLKTEMRLMLDEEIARAILVGDGRQASEPDKISEANIIPIVSDGSVYTIHATVTPGTNEELGHAIINKAIRARKDYRGSGNPTLFTTEDTLADMLLLEDGVGRRLYRDVNELATTMRVKEIVAVPFMPNGVYGIIVNLRDYNVGADKGGSINMFDDFDIDLNQQKYLIETRISGALVVPYSAIVLEAGTSGGNGGGSGTNP